MITNDTRTEISRAIAKAIAYKNCGKDEKAALWAAKLIRLLDASEILCPEYQEETELN
jgi:hypothetical protein